MNRILGIDPGDKRIGVAVSDESRTLARPLTVIEHEQRDQDAERIAELAAEHAVDLIVIGQATDSEGDPNLSGRKARRLAGALREHTFIKVLLWDETMSTQQAQRILQELGVGMEKRGGHQDALAAAVILQSYLDAQSDSLGY